MAKEAVMGTPADTNDIPQEATPVSVAEGPELVIARRLPKAKHPGAIYLATLAPGSRRGQAAALNRIARLLSGGCCGAEHLDWTAVTYGHAQAMRAAFQEELAPLSVNKHLAALRGVMREAWRLGLVEPDVYHRIADIKGVRNSRPPSGRALSAKERAALYEACAKDKNRTAGTRDVAILALLDNGLRRAEVAALNLEDLDLEDHVIRVRGKGNKERLVPHNGQTAQALFDWSALRGEQPGALLLGVRKGGKITDRRIQEQTVYQILRRRGEQAGIAHLTPHDLRRTLISEYLDQGVDIATVSAIVGHASPTTTARYDRRGEAAKRRAAALRSIPFIRGKQDRQ